MGTEHKTLEQIGKEVAHRREVNQSLALLDWMLGSRETALRLMGATSREARRRAEITLQQKAARYSPPIVEAPRLKLAGATDQVGETVRPSQMSVDEIREAMHSLAIHDKAAFDALVKELQQHGKEKVQARAA